ncbi:hypothetical protein RGV33_20580 [Pseudomonas sp. Bout1]|uniref:hypothetical protein n=1 Tax=Pseudomonas sp. Bout1 TaxID=3048600 RepID=UPI002AB50FFA|nr:hypothetical protein [Pseudomonas sp. Bout1]MDY7534045.1 hypothetical protein [Pseudomonas sp. Bout1]MEB0186026.1 hypothetical protein [Pseudomonas sp. Bout1]
MRHEIFWRFIAMILFSFTLTGCIHYEHKSAEGKSNSEIATIQQFDKSLTIFKIDDDQTLYWLSRQSEYRLGAGRHKIQVRKFITAEQQTAPIEMTVDLVGGRTYGLYGISSLSWWRYEIRDVETGQPADVADSVANETPSTSVK